MPDREAPGRRRGHPTKATCTFVLVADGDPRLGGRICRAWEEKGAIVIYCAASTATPRAIREMNEVIEVFLDQEWFVQYWPDGAPGHWLAPEPRHYEAAPLAEARVEIRPGPRIPDDAVCQHVVRDGTQLWYFAKDSITADLVREWNAFLALLIGDGLWGPGAGAGG